MVAWWRGRYGGSGRSSSVERGIWTMVNHKCNNHMGSSKSSKHMISRHWSSLTYTTVASNRKRIPAPSMSFFSSLSLSSPYSSRALHSKSFDGATNTSQNINNDENNSGGSNTRIHESNDGDILLSSLQDGVLTLTLNRPKQRHALNQELIKRLLDELDKVSRQGYLHHMSRCSENQSLLDENDVRVVVIQSSPLKTTKSTEDTTVVSPPPVFCSGHDLKELLEAANHRDDDDGENDDGNDVIDYDSDGSRQLLHQNQPRRQEQQSAKKAVEDIFHQCSTLMQTLKDIPQPTICAVHGLATAAGCQLAACCDMTIATNQSSFAAPGASTIALFCHTPAVEIVRLVGLKRTMDMTYTGRILSAQEALDYGLISRIFSVSPPSHDDNGSGEEIKQQQKQQQQQHLQFQAYVQSIAQDMAKQSVYAMQLGKKTLYEQTQSTCRKEAYDIASQAMVDNLIPPHDDNNKNDSKRCDDAKQAIEIFLQKRQRPKTKNINK